MRLTGILKNMKRCSFRLCRSISMTWIRNEFSKQFLCFECPLSLILLKFMCGMECSTCCRHNYIFNHVYLWQRKRYTVPGAGLLCTSYASSPTQSSSTMHLPLTLWCKLDKCYNLLSRICRGSLTSSVHPSMSFLLHPTSPISVSISVLISVLSIIHRTLFQIGRVNSQ